MPRRRGSCMWSMSSDRHKEAPRVWMDAIVVSPETIGTTPRESAVDWKRLEL